MHKSPRYCAYSSNWLFCPFFSSFLGGVVCLFIFFLFIYLFFLGGGVCQNPVILAFLRALVLWCLGIYTSRKAYCHRLCIWRDFIQPSYIQEPVLFCIFISQLCHNRVKTSIIPNYWCIPCIWILCIKVLGVKPYMMYDQNIDVYEWFLLMRDIWIWLWDFSLFFSLLYTASCVLVLVCAFMCFERVEIMYVARENQMDVLENAVNAWNKLLLTCVLCCLCFIELKALSPLWIRVIFR